jgi:hypothetical protein
MTNSTLGPSEPDLMLLRVITSPVAEVEARWEAWARSVDIDVLSPAAYGLLPALYKTVEAAGLTHPWVARLRGVYRRQWTESQRHLAASEAVGVVLAAAGIDFLRPADLQVSRVLREPAAQQLGRPRVAVNWWTTPSALSALTSAGWRIDDEESRSRSLRTRLTRTSWLISSDVGGTVELVNFFNPWLVDERRDADLWERARAAPGAGPPDASPADVAVAALTDQLDLPGAVRWAPGAAAVLDAVGEQVDLNAILDRRAARGVLPVIIARLRFLVDEGLGAGAGRLLSEAQELTARHPLPTTAPQRASDWGRRRVRALGRRPTAVRELVGRHGGLAGVRDYLGRY